MEFTTKTNLRFEFCVGNSRVICEDSEPNLNLYTLGLKTLINFECVPLTKISIFVLN